MFTLQGILFSFGTDLKINQMFEIEKTGMLWLAFSLCVNCFGIHWCYLQVFSSWGAKWCLLVKVWLFSIMHRPCSLCRRKNSAWTCQPLLICYCFNVFFNDCNLFQGEFFDANKKWQISLYSFSVYINTYKNFKHALCPSSRTF